MPVEVAVVVQHHPRRAELLPALLERLGDDAEVVTDPDPDAATPSPWRCYRECLLRGLDLADQGVTHLMVVQDDAHPCERFREAAGLAVEARPLNPLCLFVPGALRQAARRVQHSAGSRAWVPLDRHLWVPVVALVWPVPLIAPTLEWVERRNWPEAFRADDEIVGRAMQALRQQVLASAPSLVQHPDLVPSLVGRRARAGRDAGRIAACFAGPDCDPVTGIDWHTGAA